MTLERIGVEAIVQGIGRFTSDMGRYNTSLDAARAKTEKFATATGQAGRALAAFSAPLVALGALSLRSAIQFESAFIGVQKTVDATEEQFADLSTGIREMALEIPVAAIELANLGQTAGQLGIQVENIESFIRVMADMGVATTLSSEQAALALARFINITGLAQEDVDRLGASIVALGNTFAANELEIVNFGTRIASAGALAGFSDAQIVGVGTALAALGQQAQAGGTAVRRVLLDMVKAVITTSAELDIFAETAGLTATQFAEVFERDAGEAFTLFVEGLGRAGDDAILILDDLGLADTRLLNAFLALSGSGDKLRTTMELSTRAFAENIALVEEAEKRYASAESQVALARNEFTNMLITVGAQLVPAFLKLLDVLGPVLKFVGDMAEEFPTLTLVIVAAGVALGILAGALILLSLIMPGLIVLFPALAASIVSVGIAATFLNIALGPIGAAFLIIGVALVAGIFLWNRYEAGVRRVIDVLRTLLQFLNPIGAALGLLETFTDIDIPFIRGLPGFAEGGVQRAPGTAVVGERGPEVVSLPSMAQVSPMGSSRSNTFNVTANYQQRQDPGSIRLDLEAIAMRFGT